MISLASKALFRQRVINYAAKYGVTEASRRHRVSRQAIYEWLAKYDRKSWKSLLEKSHRPHSHPLEHTEEEKALIRRYWAKNHDDKLILWSKLREAGYTRSYKSMLRMIKRMQLQDETALHCKHIGGKPPMEYDVDPVTKRLVVNETEVVAVRLIFALYNQGKGYGYIMKALKETGYLTKCGQPEFQQKMTEFETQKSACEEEIARFSAPVKAPVVTEDALRGRVSQFQRFVAEENAPECKKFVQSFVDRVVVYHDRVEVVLMVSAAPGDGDGLTIKSEEAVKEIRGKFRVA